MWKKFELFLTPPNSPQRSVDSTDDQAPQMVPVAPSVSISALLTEFEDNEVVSRADTDVPDFDELNDVVYAELGMCPYNYDQRLISDCMWNGVGYKASAALRKAHKRTTSPQPRTPCHANGCVDPRNIFPYPVGPSPGSVRQKTANSQTSVPKRRTPVDGAETPSDSEEEIDVVTVEKGNNPATLKAKNTLSPKIVAAIVPNEDGKLAFVTNTGSSLSAKRLVRTIPQNSEGDRGRTKSKYHLLTTTTTSSNGHPTPRTVTTTLDQSKSTSQVTSKRHNADSSQGLMKMANPKLVMQRGSDSMSPVARFDKRILSLEGVSFCATNKVRQNSTTKDVNDFAETQCELDLLEQNDVALTAEFNLTNHKTNITPIEIKEETDATCNIRMQPPNKRRRKSEAPPKASPPGAGTETEQIRAAHNVLERQRREGLRTSFLTLRDNVPELQRQEKTPKVHILNKARDYCLELQRTEKNLLAEKERLMSLNQKLRDRLERSTNVLHPLRGLHHRESDLESDCEDAAIVSPMSSISSSLPPSPSVFSTGGYYIARRVSQDLSTPSQEVVLRLEPTVNPKCSNGKQVSDLVSALKQNNCQGGIRAFISPVRKSPDITNSRGSTPSDALSDGFESLSEEETAML